VACARLRAPLRRKLAVGEAEVLFRTSTILEAGRAARTQPGHSPNLEEKHSVF